MTDLPDSDFDELTVAAFLAAVVAGELTSVELVRWYLARIESNNDSGPAFHAVVTVNPQALDEAAQRDAFFASTGSLVGPLHGVPVLVKDQAESAGIRTTFGSELFAAYVPVRDATLIAKLERCRCRALSEDGNVRFRSWLVFVFIDHGPHEEPVQSRTRGGRFQRRDGSGCREQISGWWESARTREGPSGSAASFNNLFGLRVTTGLISRTGSLSPGALSGYAWSNWADSFRCRFSVGRRCWVRSG